MFTIINIRRRVPSVAARLPAKMEVMSSLLLLRDGLGTMEDLGVGLEETSAMENVGEGLEIFLGREKLGSEGTRRNCLSVQQCKKTYFTYQQISPCSLESVLFLEMGHF